MEKLLLNDVELSKALGLSLSFIRRDRANGKLGIPYLRLGRAVRYDVEQVKAWLAERSGRASEPEAPARRRGRPRKAT